MEHKLKKILQLVIGNHEGTEDSEIIQNKEDIEKNVEEILKMLHTEVNDPTSSEKSFDKSELASRIDNFHKGYQAVHGRYDNLIGELKKILELKSSGNGNSSDLKSDSGLDEYSDEREKTKDFVSLEEYQILEGQLEDVKRRNNELGSLWEEMETRMKERKSLAEEFAEGIEVLTKDLDASLISRAEKLVPTSDDAIKSQIHGVFSKIQRTKKLIEELMLVNGALREEHEKHLGLIDGLNREKEVLRSGNFAFINQIQKAEKAVADVREKADLELKLLHQEIRSQNSKLKAMEDLKAESGLLRDENSKLRSTSNNSNRELEAKAAENEALALEILVLKEEYSNALAKCMRTNLDVEWKNILCLDEISDLEDQVRSLSRVPNTGKLVSEISAVMTKLQEAGKNVDKLEEGLKRCAERIRKKKEESDTQTIESLQQQRGFIEEQVLRLEVGISGLSKAFSELEAVIQEPISVFSEKLIELKNLSAKYREETIVMMRDELAEKERELAEEYEKKRAAIREMNTMIELYPDDYYEFRAFISSLQI